jgi:hypothetical protein
LDYGAIVVVVVFVTTPAGTPVIVAVANIVNVFAVAYRCAGLRLPGTSATVGVPSPNTHETLTTRDGSTAAPSTIGVATQVLVDPACTPALQLIAIERTGAALTVIVAVAPPAAVPPWTPTDAVTGPAVVYVHVAPVFDVELVTVPFPQSHDQLVTAGAPLCAIGVEAVSVTGTPVCTLVGDAVNVTV